jgi:phytoene synthase
MASSSKEAGDGFLARLRVVDGDRYFCTLFAPAAAREELALLYLFNHELARAREVASEPLLALIRLQWWDEVVAGADKRHEIATPLRAAIARGAFAAEDLRALIEARRLEADEQIADVATFLAYVRGTAGRLARVAGKRLGADSEAVEDLGTAYGIAGLIRAAPFHAARGRRLLPVEGAAALPAAALRLCGARAPRAALPAALPAAFVRRDVARAGMAGRGLADRLAVLRAAMTGRF